MGGRRAGRVDAEPGLWAARAGVAERAVRTRHLRRVWGAPATLLGTAMWPATLGQRLHLRLEPRLQAHLLDCAVDAWLRAPATPGRTVVSRVARGLALRTRFEAGHLPGRLNWADLQLADLAWLGLALHRAQSAGAVSRAPALAGIAARLRAGWSDHSGGGIWSWNGAGPAGGTKDAAVNAAAAMLFARLAGAGGEKADLHRALSTMDWVFGRLLDSESGLVRQGLRVGSDGEVAEIDETVNAHTQGVVVGACIQLARLTKDPLWGKAAARTVMAVATAMTGPEGVPYGCNGDAIGPTTGVLLRYLAEAVTELAETRLAAARTAARLVFDAGECAWRNRAIAPGGPLFGPEWTAPAISPVERASAGESAPPGGRAERGLSVQLAGWMALEAAARLERNGVLAPLARSTVINRTIQKPAQPGARKPAK